MELIPFEKVGADKSSTLKVSSPRQWHPLTDTQSGLDRVISQNFVTQSNEEEKNEL